MSEEVLICRCQEVTEQEILDAIRDGATTVDGVKRRTRACMGLCQGKTCGRIVKGVIAAELGQRPAELDDCTARGPARPVTVSSYGNEVFDHD